MPKSTTPQSTPERPRTRKPQTNPATPIASSLNHDHIAQRAYELFLSNGAIHGRDIEHWLQAESELRDR
jgi:hypothetical protein